MTLRTPRRRISPRTKLRYRTIRDFFRRALGSTSQQEIQINSSIAVNVTDLKRKIVGLEQQLNKVNRHCRDFAYLEDCSNKESVERGSVSQYDFRHEIDTIKEQTEGSSERKSNGLETQLLYKSSDCNCKKSEDSDHLSKPNFDNKLIENPVIMSGHVTKLKKKKSKIHHNSNTSPKLHEHKTRSVYNNIFTAHSNSSFHSLANNGVNDINKDYSTCFNKPLKKGNYRELVSQHTKENKYKEIIKHNMGDHFKISNEEKPVTYRKHKRSTRDLDSDFIADIIRKQYKPMKMFGRKESDFSQFSAPVCRDHEFTIKENIQEGSELCSCCYSDLGQRKKRIKHQELGEMRSMCDTRLYSSKKHFRQKRRKHVDAYSNSDMYDLVPVKERSSPKTRRKYIDESMIPCYYYREVPPSPRTLRPQLNLKAQYYTELEDYLAHKNQKYRRFPQTQKVYPKHVQHFEVETASEIYSDRNKARAQNQQKNLNIPIQEAQFQDQSVQDTCAINNFQYVNEQTSTAYDTSLNKTQETEISVDKTDKALCEIKDILQSFLLEIKKETVASQCDKSEFKTPNNDNEAQQDGKSKTNKAVQNSASYNSYGSGPRGASPFMSSFTTNPCCYPIMPICPLNYPMQLQNGGYVIPSPSYTCSNCVTGPKDSMSAHCCSKNIEPVNNTETDELIKEIYKFVARGPVRNQDNSNEQRQDHNQGEAKILTSRSVGESFKNYQHNVKVGTQPLKCYSKSCEAIGSRMVSDTYCSGTNPSYSDTLLEKLSLEAGTHSASETELDVETAEVEKSKGNKLSKVLRSIRLFKKKKKDVIEELSESESVTELDFKPKQPLFRQQVTNYVMHGQEYYNAPSTTPLYERPQGYPQQTNYYRRDMCEYQAIPHDYGPRTHECHARPQGYQPRPHEYQSQPHEYQSPRHQYQPKQNEHQHIPNEYPLSANDHQHRPQEYQPDYHPPYNPGVRDYPSPQLGQRYGQHLIQRPRDHPGIRSSPRHRPSAPPFASSHDTSYSQMQPPLCLKEIEVKSTGTQSERKMSIFRKFKKTTRQPSILAYMAAGDQRSFSTQTAVNAVQPMTSSPPKIIKPLFNWKRLQEKAKKVIPSPDLDPMQYSYKTQKELAHGNLKIRKAMLKKLFNKRNPFSPRNIIVKTLLGKDPTSYGEAPAMLRPRMFF